MTTKRRYRKPIILTPQQEQRFLVRYAEAVAASTGHPDCCYLYQGPLLPSGYGRFYTGNHVYLAHRVAWEVLVGPIPEGDDGLGLLNVLHHCDNPPCIRREHLFVGTQAENNADMLAKDRQGGAPADNARKIRCLCGKPYDARNSSGDRFHRACRQEYNRRYRKGRLFLLTHSGPSFVTVPHTPALGPIPYLTGAHR